MPAGGDVRIAEWASNTAHSAAQTAGTQDAKGDLLAALAGKQAARDRAVAHSTRRVVLTSLGVIEEQRANRQRVRALALAALLVMLLALGPFVWRVTDDLIGGEHLADMATQMSLWLCILCPVILAAVLVAGWARSRQ
jgi:hypothetical protein